MHLSNIYSVPLGSRDASITAPLSAKIASISAYVNAVAVVLEIDPTQPMVERTFRSFIPGQQIPEGYEHRGSCWIQQNPYILYERV